jgi:ferredoxin
MKLSVDMIACEGRGLCAEVLPELIRLDDWGYPMIISRVPPELEEQAREAVRLCPTLALRLQREARADQPQGQRGRP